MAAACGCREEKSCCKGGKRQMETRIAEHIRIIADIPLLHAERFEMHWKPDGHASLSLEGYINTRIAYQIETLYNSKITLILEKGGDRTDETAGEGRMAEKSERAGDGRTAPPGRRRTRSCSAAMSRAQSAAGRPAQKRFPCTPCPAHTSWIRRRTAVPSSPLGTPGQRRPGRLWRQPGAG